MPESTDLTEITPVEQTAEQTPPVAPAVADYEPFTEAQNRKISALIIAGKSQAARELRTRHKERYNGLNQSQLMKQLTPPTPEQLARNRAKYDEQCAESSGRLPAAELAKRAGIPLQCWLDIAREPGAQRAMLALAHERREAQEHREANYATSEAKAKTAARQAKYRKEHHRVSR